MEAHEKNLTFWKRCSCTFGRLHEFLISVLVLPNPLCYTNEMISHLRCYARKARINSITRVCALLRHDDDQRRRTNFTLRGECSVKAAERCFTYARSNGVCVGTIFTAVVTTAWLSHRVKCVRRRRSTPRSMNYTSEACLKTSAQNVSLQGKLRYTYMRLECWPPLGLLDYVLSFRTKMPIRSSVTKKN